MQNNIVIGDLQDKKVERIGEECAENQERYARLEKFKAKDVQWH